jgi:hypothetical protein
MSILMFSEKDPTEAITYAVDFVKLLDGATLSAASVTLTVSEGTDASAASMVFGAPSVSSITFVKQRIGSGVDGVTYRINFNALTSTGDTVVAAVYLPVNTQ